MSNLVFTVHLHRSVFFVCIVKMCDSDDYEKLKNNTLTVIDRHTCISDLKKELHVTVSSDSLSLLAHNVFMPLTGG